MKIKSYTLSAFAVLALPLSIQLQAVLPASAEDSRKAAAEEQPAYVYVDGQRVIGVIGRNGPLTREERLKMIQSRIDNIFASHSFEPAKFRAVDDEFGTRIFYGDENVMLVTSDEAQLLKITSRALAADYIHRLQDVAEDYKRDSRSERLALGIFGALSGLFALLLLFSKLGALADRSSAVLSGYIERLIPTERIEIFKDFVSQTTVFICRTFFYAFSIALLYGYACTVLNFFPWTKVYGRQLLERTLSPLTSALHDVSEYIPNLFIILVLAYLTHGALSLFKFVFDEIGKQKLVLPDFDPDWAEPTYKLVKALTLFLAVVMAAPYLPGWESPAFKQIGLFIGLLVSLGSTGAVGHLVAGVVLTYTRAFKIGDRIKIGEYTGDIIERTLFTTRIRTIKNETVTLHNGQVITSEIVNYSANARSQGLILHTTVTIGYDESWRKIQDLLLKAAARCPNLLTAPAPFVLQRALSDYYVEYELNVFSDRADNMVSAYSELHAAILDVFDEAAVEIMSPAYTALRDGNLTALPSKPDSERNRK